MGKAYNPPSESFCQFVFNVLVQRFENDLEFFKTENLRKRKKCKVSSGSVVKLLNCSNNAVEEYDIYVSAFNDLKEAGLCSKQNTFSCEQIGNKNDNFLNACEEIPVSRKDLELEGIREKVSATFKDYVHKKLKERLEEQVILSYKMSRNLCKPSRAKLNCGIFLFKSANSRIQKDYKQEFISYSRKSKKKTKLYDKHSHKEMLKESVVRTDWILSRSGITGWCETKRPRILKLKVVSTLSDGAQECEEIL